MMNQKAKIFIVEDHPVMREGYTMLFETIERIEICGIVATAEEALEQIPAAGPDLILVDVSLPGMSGIDLVNRLREQCLQVPIIVLTGLNDERYAEAALEAGANSFIAKGNPKQMLQEIQQALTKEASERASDSFSQ
jgi:DNA-binding NarL/FixJ family response regulator